MVENEEKIQKIDFYDLSLKATFSKISSLLFFPLLSFLLFWSLEIVLSY